MKIFMFDVDGTLTPSRQVMSQQFDNFMFRWGHRNNFWLVSGSDLDKMKEQVPEHILDLAEGLFTCGGNQLYVNGELIYDNKFKVPETLLTYLGEELRMTDYPVKAGNHIEDRGSMLNFSIGGRNCTQNQREDYYRYDNLTGERKRISKYIREQWKDIDAVIGGQISIDIVPKGFDKSQIMKHIDETYKKRNVDDCEYIFYGDRTEEGGNDYPLAQLLESRSDGRVHKVENWLDTMEQLQNNKFWK